MFPVAKTVADINLEQVGRTDDDEGPQVGTATMTGLDYSDIGAIFQAAGQALGVKVYKHPKNSDAYFSRSDNQSLANQGARAYARRCVLVSGLSRRRRPLGQDRLHEHGKGGPSGCVRNLPNRPEFCSSTMELIESQGCKISRGLEKSHPE